MHPFWIMLLIFESLYCLVTTKALLSYKKSQQEKFAQKNKILTASQVILQKKQKDKEFIQICAEEDYDAFVRFYTEKSSTKCHRDLYSEKNIKFSECERLFDLLSQEENMNLYKEVFQRQGWYILANFTGSHKNHDYRLSLTISPEPITD